MATVKIHEGTKLETPLNLEDGEGIIFVQPKANRMQRFYHSGCLMALLTIITLGIISIFKPTKRWYINLVITDKRLITIPTLPNKRNFEVESYYFKDMVRIKDVTESKEDEMKMAAFTINMKKGGNSKYEEGGEFWIHGAPTVGKFVKGIGGGILSGLGDVAGQIVAQGAAADKTAESRRYAEATGASTYTEYSVDYGAMEKAAKARMANVDTSNMDHNLVRDCIFELVEKGIELANK